MRTSGETRPARVDVPDTGALAAQLLQQNLLDLIEVRAPYCALQRVESSELGSVTAQIVPEQEVDLEVGVIPAAEAGRHMAILGSIACATRRAERAPRAYYLAERALLRSPEHGPRSRLHAPLRLSARCLTASERQSEADCEIRDADDAVLFGLRVGYKLVPEKVFQRLFAAHRVDMRRPERRMADSDYAVGRQPPRHNPYHRRLRLAVAELDERRMRGELSSVPAEACAGHFPLYPAVPVAVLMEAFSNAGGALLRRRLGEPELRYRVRSADITASKLVFAGRSITIFGDVLAEVPASGLQMQMRACLSSGEEVSRATFVMQGMPSGGDGRSAVAGTGASP